MPDQQQETESPTTSDASDTANTEDELSTAVDSSEVPDEGQGDDEPDTFPRSYVEELRQENGRYRQRAQRGDELAHRLHTELVKATGRLADPTDMAFDETHLDDPEALTAAIDELLESKPHLASRRPSGDIGQGQRGPASGFSLLDMLKERT